MPPVFPGRPPNPLGLKVELLRASTSTWTDITSFVQQRNPVQITGFGRADWTSTLQAAQLTLTLKNTDGRFSPKNSSGAYYPDITRNAQIRVSVNAQSVTGVTYSGYRFWGEVAEWPLKWDPRNTDVYVSITAAGPWRRMSQLQTTLGSAYTRYVDNLTGGNAVQAFWPMEDGTGSTAMVPFGSPAGTANATWAVLGTNAPSLAASSPFKGSDAIPQLNAAALTATVHSGGTPANNVTRFVLSVPAAGDSASGTVNWNLAEINSAGTIAKFEVYLNFAGTLLMQLRNSGGTVLASGTTTTNVKGQPYLVSCELTPSGGNVAFAMRLIKPGAAGITESLTGTVTAASAGAVTTVRFGRANVLMDTAAGQLSVAYGSPVSLVQAAYALNGYTGEFAMDRFTRICAEMGVATEVIGTNTTTAPMGPQVDATFADVLQAVEDVDLGLLYETKDQFGLGYRALTSMANQAVAVTLNYTAALIDPSLAPVFDDQLTRNYIQVTNWTGYTQGAVLTAGPMSVLNPPNGIGNGYNYSRSVSAAADSQLPGIANWLLNVGSVDEIRFPVIAVNLARTTTAPLFASLPGLRTGDYVQITNPPGHLSGSGIKQLIWGSSETLNAFAWMISFNCVPETPYETGFSPGTVQLAQLPGGSAVQSSNPGGTGLSSLIANGSITPAMLNNGITIRTLGGNAVTISASAPAAPNVNDIWIASATGLISQWNGASWAPFKFDAGATIQAATITSALLVAGTIVAGNIAAGTITSALLATGIVVAGIVDATTINGATLVLSGTSGEELVYSGTPAFGNLIGSWSGAAGSDVPGNPYPKGLLAQALTLQDQSSSPGAFAGSSVLYSDFNGRLWFKNDAGASSILDRSGINMAVFPIGNISTPTNISAPMTYFASESNQSSEFEIAISGLAHMDATNVKNFLFALFIDGTSVSLVTADAIGWTVNQNIGYDLAFRISFLSTGPSATAFVSAAGIACVAGSPAPAASLALYTQANNVAIDSTVNHTFQIRGYFQNTTGTTTQGMNTYRTRLTRRN